MNLRRKLTAAFSAAAIVVGGGLLFNVLTPSPAAAHGAQMFPGSRQFLCWQHADTGGTPVATNPMCAAMLANDQNVHWNWFANLNSFNNGATVGTIPDGRICDGNSAAPFDFTPINNVGAWPYTHVTAGATYQFRHNDWAHHPGKFDVYITTPNWNSSTPLAWSELELIHTAVDPPRASGPDGLGYYFWDVTLPNRTGEHIIFVHWVRSDSPEDFFNCSDVVFDGGNGQVTVPGGNNPPPPPTSPSPPPPSSPPASPPPPPSSPSPPPPTGDCSVHYHVTSDWGQSFQGEVTVTNSSATAVSGWQLAWTWPSGQEIQQLWNGVHTQTGANVTVSAASWNGTLAAGGSATVGFLASPGGGAAPSSFTLNGVACTVI